MAELVGSAAQRSLVETQRGGGVGRVSSGTIEDQVRVLGRGDQRASRLQLAHEVARNEMQQQMEVMKRERGCRHEESKARSGVQWTRCGMEGLPVVFKSCEGCANPGLKDEMTIFKRKTDPVVNSRLQLGSEVRASNGVFHLLLRSTSGSALDRVVKAGEQVKASARDS